MKRFLLPILAAIVALSSCDDTTETIGSSLTDFSDMLDVATATYPVSSESVVVDSVLSRSNDGYIGCVKDPETNSYVKCNFATQFHTLEGFNQLFPPLDTLYMENGEIEADSCSFILSYTGFYGDSLALMNLTLHELDHPMRDGAKYYSSFNPKDYGYLRDGGIHKSVSYTLADQSIKYENDYLPFIKVELNEPYTDKQGKTYSNYGTYVMRKYYEDPSSFNNSYKFLNNVCPGFYVESTNGTGTMTSIYASQLNIQFRYVLKRDEKPDTLIRYTANFSGTEEVLQNTNVQQDYNQISLLANDNSCTYIKTPAGIYTRVTLPVDEVLRDSSNLSVYQLRKDTLSTARMIIKRYNNSSLSKYSLPIPKTLLVVRDTLKDEFFEKRMVTDGRSSTLVSYSSTDNGYNFSNISKLIIELAKEKCEYLNKHPELTSDDYNRMFPNWNKFCLIPVNVTYTTVDQASVVARITHDMSLGSTRLEGGKGNPGSIKLSVIYSKFRSK